MSAHAHENGVALDSTRVSHRVEHGSELWPNAAKSSSNGFEPSTLLVVCAYNCPLLVAEQRDVDRPRNVPFGVLGWTANVYSDVSRARVCREVAPAGVGRTVHQVEKHVDGHLGCTLTTCTLGTMTTCILTTCTLGSCTLGVRVQWCL
jgi:hypothetical protein